MDSIIQFFQNFGQYCLNAKDSLGYCLLMPPATLAAIWLLTFVILKIINRENLKTVFQIHRSVIIGSLIVATILVAIICYYWSKNTFAENKAELAFIISLTTAFFVPIVSLLLLRNHWSKHKVNNIVNQPISAEQARNNIPVINKAFNKNKLFYLLPLIGFLFLLFSLNSGKNLISIVFDNSVSMDLNAATNALTKTFDKLNDNNEIIFTNLNNVVSDKEDTKIFKDILAIKQSKKIKIGANYAYNTPKEAGLNFQSTILEGEGSPICEAIWKMWLFTKETKANNEYKNKLLIVITDGDENYADINSLQQNTKFFYEDAEFAEYYAPENTYIVDYSQNSTGIVIKKFDENGAIIYPAVTSVDDYLSALDDALLSFQNNIYLIAWTIAICVIFTLIGLCITPKKITI